MCFDLPPPHYSGGEDRCVCVCLYILTFLYHGKWSVQIPQSKKKQFIGYYTLFISSIFTHADAYRCLKYNISVFPLQMK